MHWVNFIQTYLQSVRQQDSNFTIFAGYRSLEKLKISPRRGFEPRSPARQAVVLPTVLTGLMENSRTVTYLSKKSSVAYLQEQCLITVAKGNDNKKFSTVYI